MVVILVVTITTISIISNSISVVVVLLNPSQAPDSMVQGPEQAVTFFATPTKSTAFLLHSLVQRDTML